MIDFTQARLFDPAWWRRCHILLTGLADEDDLACFQAIYSFHLALVGNSGLTDDSFRTAQDNAKDIFHEIIKLLRPWEEKGKSSQELKEQEVQELREAYKAAFGFDIDDKEEEQRRLQLWREAIEKNTTNEADVMEQVLRRSEERKKRIAALERVYRQKRLQGR